MMALSISKYILWSERVVIEGARVIIEIWGTARLCVDLHYKGDWMPLIEVSI